MFKFPAKNDLQSSMLYIAKPLVNIRENIINFLDVETLKNLFSMLFFNSYAFLHKKLLGNVIYPRRKQNKNVSGIQKPGLQHMKNEKCFLMMKIKVPE